MTSLLKDDAKYVRQQLDLVLQDIRKDNKTAVPIPNSAEPGYSEIYRNKVSVNGLYEVLHPSLATLHDLFEAATVNFPKKNSLGWRELREDGTFGKYQFETYMDTHKRKRDFGAGLFFILRNNPYKTDSPTHKRIDSEEQHEMGPFVVTIFSANRAEWAITDLACISYSIVNTSLYDTLGPETSKYILELSESSVIVCSKDKVRPLIDLKAKFPKELSNLITIVSMDDIDANNPITQDSNIVFAAKRNNIAIYDFKQVEKLGEINAIPEIPPTPDTIYTISFTSGTTGSAPKGVVLNHRNGVGAVTFCFGNQDLPDDGIAYCFLPLAHIYQRMTLLFSLAAGAAVGFPQSSSPLTLIEDVKELRPHVLNLVPRVYTKLESAIKVQTIHNDEKPIIKSLFSRAIDTKMALQSQHDGAEGRHLLYDRVTGLLRKKLGMDNMLVATSGSAPIATDTVKFIKSALNCGMIQGYGLTESFAGVCASGAYESKPGSCGPICMTTEARLKDLPEMNYLSTDEGGPRGELLLRGPQIFVSYYKNEEETKKSIDKDGWFNTGDVARIEEGTGNIYIIDRVKNFFKLAQGEYITPEKIENTYLSASPLVQQIYAHGDSLKTFLVAIIGIDPEGVTAWVKQNLKKDVTSNEELVKIMNEKENKKKFLSSLNGKVSGNLHGFEKIHNVLIDIEPLTIENNVITPTLKIKRGIASKFFADVFNKLYEEGSLIRETDTKL